MVERVRLRLTLVMVALVLAGVMAAAWAKDAISDAKVVRWVEKTVAERQPVPEAKRFEEIGWARTFAPRSSLARSTTGRSFS
jgi:hypothetical protein